MLLIISPEIITIDDQNFGSHVEHWNLLTDHPATHVPQWLGLALDAPVMPMGLCQQECDMEQSTWLIQGPQKAAVQIAQVIAVENNKPQRVKTAFPSFESPYKVTASIERIITCTSNAQAVLRLNLGANSIVYAFDSLYSVNHLHYEKDQPYLVQLNAWAYGLEAVSDHEQLVVDDPASIKHHRALNDILAANDGVAPTNLQEQIDAWKKQHGDIYAIKVDGKTAYLKKPDRKTLSFASVAGQKDPMKFNEIILENCFIGGDEEIKKDDSLFLAASAKIVELIEVKEAELVKL